MKTIIGLGIFRSFLQFGFQSIWSGCWREGVGHVDEGGYSSQDRSVGFAADVGFPSQPWIPEVDMGVNSASHQDPPVEVYFLSAREGTFIMPYSCDSLTVNT